MPRSCAYRLATLAVRITNLIAKSAKALDHTCAAPENSFERILRVLTRRDVKPLRGCLSCDAVEGGGRSISGVKRNFAMAYVALKLNRSVRYIEGKPPMAAGVSKRLSEIGDIVEVLEAWEAVN